MNWNNEDRDAVRATLRRVSAIQTDDSRSQTIDGVAVKQQTVKLSGLKSEQLDKIMRALPHGFSSHAPKGSEGLLLSLSGRADRATVLGLEHPDKAPKNLPEGGVALYDADGKILKVVKDSTDWDFGKKPVVFHDGTTIVVKGSDYVAIGIEGGRWVVVRSDRVDIAVKSPDERATPQVVTTAGPSGVAFCRVD